MGKKKMDRKAFLGSLSHVGAAACLCAAAGGMRSALAEEQPPKPKEPPAKPGDKTPERAVKRMEFADGWVPRFFSAMDLTLDEPSRRKLMEANGKACFLAFSGPPKQKARPDEFERFSKWAAENGKAQGYTVEGRTIFFEFVGSAETGQASPERLCLCPMAEAQSPGKISPTYCHCSVGYVREMHERLLGRTVSVELLDSVLRGGKRCRFKIVVA